MYNLGEKDILYIDLFSNSIYMGSDDSGMPIPVFKTSTGTYHMSGCLEVAPEAFLRKRFRVVHRVLEAAGAATIICALPLPRFVKMPCCNSEAHMTNWTEADFTDILKNSSETCSSIIRVEGERLGLTIAVFNPLSCFGHAEELADIKSSAGLTIWREDDPVHLSAAAYGDISAVISNQAETTSRQPTAGPVRRRLESVVPAPTAAPMTIREPDWISGQLRPARGGQRGGQRGGKRGGQWRARGGGS